MTGRRRRDLLEAGILVLLALFLHTGGLALQTQARLADKVVRLHILANSDDPADQALKLRVRDAVLSRSERLLEGARDRSEAAARLRRALPELEETAKKTLAENDWYGPVSARVGESAFPTKEYDGFSLPAGRYLALQIAIGAGGGHNWWCVVFPPLCTAAATEEDRGYVLKFKIVEWWEWAREWCTERF